MLRSASPTPSRAAPEIIRQLRIVPFFNVRSRRLLQLLSLSILALVACGRDDAAPPADPPAAATGRPAVDARDAPFVDITAASGLDFTHWNGMVGGYDYPEMMGSGVALLDYDGDGDLDVYFVQSGALRPERIADAVFPPPERPGDRLFRNDLVVHPDGSRTLRFTDVTEAAGLAAASGSTATPGYGMGAAAADFDNDGDVDLYITRLGRNRLLLNRGDGTFLDASAGSGADDARWSVPAIPLDFDRDGRLDLFVGNYVAWSAAADPDCTDELGMTNYCGPLAFRPQVDTLLRGLGDGTFEDVGERAGIREEYGGALGAAALDYDDDGLLDLYVGNDGMPNQLWRNLGDGRFVNAALEAGVAVSGEGNPEASMGIAAADVDDDGDEDLFITHLTRETNTFYQNEADGHFSDRSTESGLGAPSFRMTGFGAGFLDFDNDGRLDLLTVNGAVKVVKEQRLSGDDLPLRQADQLFRNLGPDAAGRSRFEEVRGIAALAREGVSRGAAFGDLDNDGDVDVVVVDNSGPARLLRGEPGAATRWLGLRLALPAGDGERDAWGARATLILPDGRRLSRRVGATASYASSSDPRLLFGLGGAAEEQDLTELRLRVRWPDGGEEEWTDLEIGRYTTLRRGAGTAVGGAS